VKKPKPAGGRNRMLAMLGIAGVAGIALGFIVRPFVAPPGKIGELETEVAASTKSLKTVKDKAEFLETENTDLKKSQDELQKKLADTQTAKSTLESKAADVDKKAKEIADVEAKLKATIDNASGSVSHEGDEIHLQLVDKVLFKLNDDQLTDKGKLLIDKVATALKDLPDKQVWVQGHTDDQPIFNPPPPKQPPLKKGQKPPPPPPPPRFATNWELSAARALNVVHYLQDVGKVDPTRLAAVAFGQYRPISRTNKALNRRIEIVLYPKREILKR
jgi:chemotaxis protein MotB